MNATRNYFEKFVEFFGKKPEEIAQALTGLEGNVDTEPCLEALNRFELFIEKVIKEEISVQNKEAYLRTAYNFDCDEYEDNDFQILLILPGENLAIQLLSINLKWLEIVPYDTVEKGLDEVAREFNTLVNRIIDETVAQLEKLDSMLTEDNKVGAKRKMPVERRE